MRREVVVLREMVIVGVCACRWIHASMVCVCVCVCVFMYLRIQHTYVYLYGVRMHAHSVLYLYLRMCHAHLWCGIGSVSAAHTRRRTEPCDTTRRIVRTACNLLQAQAPHTCMHMHACILTCMHAYKGSRRCGRRGARLPSTLLLRALYRAAATQS